MSEQLNPEVTQPKPPEVDENEIRRMQLQMIVDKGIDRELLKEKQATMTLDERVSLLELEMERRVQENARLTLSFAVICTKIGPAIDQIFNHFFGAV